MRSRVHTLFPPSMFQAHDFTTDIKRGPAATGSMFDLYFRLNTECETDYETCGIYTGFECDQHAGPHIGPQRNHDGICMPSQLSNRVKICNRNNDHSPTFKICDGAFTWCDGGNANQKALQPLGWVDMGCAHVISKECEIRHHCYQNCLKQRQSARCNFFAIDSEAFHKSRSADPDSRHFCQTFSTLDGTGFSSSSCGPWKVYQMRCVNGVCGDVTTVMTTSTSAAHTILSTTMSTVEEVDSTTVSDYVVCFWIFACVYYIHFLLF